MFDATTDFGRVEPLRDEEFEPFLATAPGFVVVEFSTNWSRDCRLLRPLVAKLAHAFAGHVIVVALDGDAAHRFRARYGVDAVPQLLAFEKRRLIGRYVGAPDLKAVQDWFRTTLRLYGRTKCDGDAAFSAAWSRARATFDDIFLPADLAVRPHLDAAALQMDAFERQLTADREAGRITDDQEMERRSVAFERLFAPFRPQMDALATAERTALAAYEDLMAEALDEFRASSHCRSPEACACS